MKKEVSFYHLTSTPVEKALPHLVFKIYNTNVRCLIVCKDDQQMREINDVLWSFSTKKFIPHGSTEEDNKSIQPVLVSTSIDELSNNPEVVVILNNQNINSNTNFKNHIYMVYGNKDDSNVSQFYNLYQSYTSKDYNTKLWTLDKAGKWVNADSRKMLD
ncbi:MAG: DNA polymerase III subunit chi [Alphaproteobacteria bacterium]|nr:DNA polymerase III subunit chi [Alphaproteobacteria bacterium]